VHEVRGLAGGGAVIRTPFSGQLKRIMANKKFSEPGLEIKIVVSNVDTAHTPEDVMTELYKSNFAEKMELTQFRRTVRLEKPWSQVNGATVNVTLEVDATALDVLDGGRHILDGSTTKWPVAGWIRRTGSADSAGRLAKMREAAQIRWTAGIAASGANHRRTICCPLGALCMRWC